MIYDHGGENDEAAQLRMLLSTAGINDMRKEFKSRLKSSSPRECIDYAVGWTVLLYDNSNLHHRKRLLSELKVDKRASDWDSYVLVAICILGNCVLAQTMMSRGVSIDQPIAIDSEEFDQTKITPIQCAVLFENRNLVRILLEANKDDSWVKRPGESCLKFALRHEDSQFLQILFDHMPKDCAAGKSKIFTLAVLKGPLNNKGYKMAGVLLENVPSDEDNPKLVKAILEAAIDDRDRTAVRVILKDARQHKHGAPALLDGHRKISTGVKNDLESLEVLLIHEKPLSMTHSGDILLSQAIQTENVPMLEAPLQKKNLNIAAVGFNTNNSSLTQKAYIIYILKNFIFSSINLITTPYNKKYVLTPNTSKKKRHQR